MKHIEIVAPWWSYEKAMIAANFGAESVYLWVPFTSLRMRQNKLKTFEELKKTISDLHSIWSKALLTMNIFPRNDDIKIFESVVEQISDLWADAIIFSDLWTYNIIRKYLPNINLHLSTQASTLNYESVRFWADLWVNRIVCARELNIQEIAEIKKNVPSMELEAFVHWAMCMSYSGRCLLWDYMSWRPWNKWECSHACRFKYKVHIEEERRPWKKIELWENEDGTYLLSSKDLCTIQKLDKILPYVDAIKIEWRSKSEFYVGAMVKAYKHVRDSIINNQKIDKNVQDLVNVIPHREYWEWFIFNDLKNYPDWESFNTTTKTSPWPIITKKYFGLVKPKIILKNWKKYSLFIPKEVIKRWDIMNFISFDIIWEIKVINILSVNEEEIEKWTCNMKQIYVCFDKDLKWWETLYK